ncbi:MAG: MCE family protein [Planctomycetes bacterium]|nr:MCE family protein [Planctomycetota bacterium]
MRGERLVGVVSLTFVGALLLTAVLLGDWSLSGGHYRVQAVFHDGDRLKSGNAIYLAGVEVGKVEKIRFEGEQIVATLRIHRACDIPENAHVEIRAASAFGGQEVTITHGRGVPQGRPLPKDGSARVHESRPLDLMKEFGDLSEEFSRASGSFRQVANHITGGHGAFGSLAYDEKMAGHVRAIAREAEDFAEAVRHGDGTLGAFLEDPSLNERIRAALDRFNEVAASIREEVDAVERQDGVLGALLRDDALWAGIDRLQSSARGLARKADAGQGVLANLLNDSPLRRKWDEAMAHLDSIQAKIAAPSTATVQE